MKRSNELRKPGNNIPTPRGYQKNKHLFYKIKQQEKQRLKEEQAKFEKEAL